ncbi:PKD domain-containing protein [Mucilaginibacter pallidiroseus]|uniref:PKD domain-containing protein n=1 Tax=Mucilaginibacter pallidiroseus TaxID=2599295 RepID=A0A563UK96_9SPHI|nr:PKD domain-containing protein [Mucilaginibacter pallidiroseus]TWR31698.1 PKD domain-containing protein [Mucilaginibacter pallidiroseus]
MPCYPFSVNLNFKAFAVLALLLALMCSRGHGQTNQGKEFWTAYMSHQEDTQESQMSLYITGDQNTTGTVEVADGSFTIPFNVTARQVTVVTVPHSAFIKQGGKYLKGVHITAKRNIAVYAHIFAQSVSGATLLLPVNALGRDYKSINFTQKSNARQPSYSTLMVVATEDNTTVEITPTADLISPAANASFVPFTVVLKKGEVFQGLSQKDLTGSRVRSVASATGECKKIAVYSGSTKIGIGCSEGANLDNFFSSDNLFQQVYPTSSWGKNYVTVPLKNRSYDICRIVFSEPNTIVKINGFELNAASTANSTYYEFNSSIVNVITADKPVQVAQYAVTQGKNEFDCSIDASDIGDPEMIYLNPLEQTIDHVTLYSSPNAYIVSSYINVVIPTSAVSTFLLDGTSVSSAFKTVDGNPAYSYAQLNVAAGTHYVNAAKGFNAIAYGFGQRESYGYSAGTNLQNLNQKIEFVDVQNGSIKVGGCADVEYKLKLTLPYQPNQIRWVFSDGSPSFTDAAPVAKSVSVKDGQSLYTFEFYKSVKYAPGDYTVIANVVNPQGNDCGTESAIEFDFNISAFPQVVFTADNTCLNEQTQFTDVTDQTNNTIKSWHWDFGDGQSSNDKDPIHPFLTAGSYTVTLTVINENGCSSFTSKQYKILPKPAASFLVTTPACVNTPLTFTDQSVSEGVLKQWIWEFGDGAVETRTNNQSFTHTYIAAGTYQVKLTLVTESGCTALKQQQIVIGLKPIVDFALPDVCIADAFAQFTNKSALDSSANGLTYLWNFGDNASAPGLNTSTEANPKHRYAAAGVYTVSLTVTSAGGCPQTLSKQFTVNGSVPKARFTVVDPNNLCSAAEVVIKDASTVDFGRITRIILYYDYGNQPQIFETFANTNIPTDGVYKHLYPVSTSTKIYKIRMAAFSGGVCESIYEQDITVKGNPVASIVPVPPMCYNDPPVPLTGIHDGYNGTGTFSGPGVTANGFFDPKLAGIGNFTVSYQFIAANGCDVVAQQVITVNALPVVNAGANFTMLEGGQAVLPAVASGTGLKYKWTPSTGLDHDDVLNPVISPVEDITYTLTVTNSYGCSVSDAIFVAVLKKPIVVNTFTPNGDGVNDLWNIRYLDSYPGSTVEIFSRAGQKVYSSVGYAHPWDGKLNGSELPAGTYYYIINPKNGRQVIAGNVTIIR